MFVLNLSSLLNIFNNNYTNKFVVSSRDIGLIFAILGPQRKSYKTVHLRLSNVFIVLSLIVSFLRTSQTWAKHSIRVLKTNFCSQKTCCKCSHWSSPPHRPPNPTKLTARCSKKKTKDSPLSIKKL